MQFPVVNDPNKLVKRLFRIAQTWLEVTRYYHVRSVECFFNLLCCGHLRNSTNNGVQDRCETFVCTGPNGAPKEVDIPGGAFTQRIQLPRRSRRGSCKAPRAVANALLRYCPHGRNSRHAVDAMMSKHPSFMESHHRFATFHFVFLAALALLPSFVTAATLTQHLEVGSQGKPPPPPTPPPAGGRSCPAYPSFPDASCTGVPAGTALTVKTGNQTISTAGIVVDGWDVRGKIIINAANVTVKNSIVHGPAAGGCNNGAAIEINADNAIIQDTEVLMDNPTACLDGIWMNGNFGTLTRVNVHGGTDGVKAGTDPAGHDYLIQDSYIHDMKWFASDPNQGGGETHNDGIQTWAGVHNITLTHNRIDLSNVLNIGGSLASNSAWQDSGYNSRAEYNYLDGGGCTLNFAAQSLRGGATLQPMYVNHNHFGRHQGYTGCVSLFSLKTVMTQYNGNVWQDTGLPVPAPQQHD